jgi:hypothetical protein
VRGAADTVRVNMLEKASSKSGFLIDLLSRNVYFCNLGAKLQKKFQTIII